MASETYTETYTVADVGKVLDCFAADFDMIAQSTGLRTCEDVAATSADVKLMAQYGYIAAVSVFVRNAVGGIPTAAKYEVSTGDGALTASRPGNALWPRTTGSTLCVQVDCTPAWIELSGAKREEFRKKLQQAWGPASVDTNFPGLTRSLDRNYVSNGYALKKSIFQ